MPGCKTWIYPYNWNHPEHYLNALIYRGITMIKLIFTIGLAGLLCAPASAHHTWAVDYDTNDFIEIEGVVSSIRWVNPHVRFEVIVDAGTNSEQKWNIAGTSVSNLARMDVTSNILSVGDSVLMAGYAAKQSDHGMYMVNLLLPDGRQAIFSGSAEPRWTGEIIGSGASLRGEVLEQDISNRPDSIFSVWTTITSNPESRTLHPRSSLDYPLSETALEKISAYNPETEDPFGSCFPKGGSLVMDAPYPVEFVDQGTTILFKLEEYDLVRTIHLTDIHDDRNVEPSLLGYSTARWQGDTLLVTTTKIDYPFLNVGSVPDYIPQGQHALFQESLRLGSERDRLHYSLTVTDTEMLTEPLVMRKYYLWRPGESVQPYLCDEEGLFVTD
jgi:hypothetical protein